MSTIKTGDSVFPRPEMLIQGELIERSSGMMLRDYFAAKAMQGFVVWGDSMPNNPGYYAEHAYKMADAMIAERAKDSQ